MYVYVLLQLFYFSNLRGLSRFLRNWTRNCKLTRSNDAFEIKGDLIVKRLEEETNINRHRVTRPVFPSGYGEDFNRLPEWLACNFHRSRMSRTEAIATAARLLRCFPSILDRIPWKNLVSAHRILDQSRSLVSLLLACFSSGVRASTVKSSRE